VTPTEAIATLLSIFRAELRAAVRDAQTGDAAKTYSSRALPPRTTRRRFRELCVRGAIAGAWKEGPTWCCTCQAWEEARVRRMPAGAAQATPAAKPLAAQADALLARSGLRIVRKS
jgi:hypothetical protein